MAFSVDEVLQEGASDLYRRMADGYPVDLRALDDTEYHGIALGNPRFVEWLTWKTFKKVFRREEDGTLRGWNVAVEQRGVEGPFVDRLRRGARITYWHYGVAEGRDYPSNPFPRGAMIDYGLQERGVLNGQRLIRDPLVALEAGSADTLLGYSYVALGPFTVPTPTFFLLRRGQPLIYDVPSPASR